MQPAHLDSRSGLQVDAEVTAHSHLPLTRSPPRPCRCEAEVHPHLQRNCASQREQLRLASQGRWDSRPGGLGLLAEQNPAPRWVRPAPRLHSRGCRRKGHSGLRQILQSLREGLFCPGSRPPFKGPGASFLTLSCDVRPAGPGAGVHPSREGRRRHPTGSWPQLRPPRPHSRVGRHRGRRGREVLRTAGAACGESKAEERRPQGYCPRPEGGSLPAPSAGLTCPPGLPAPRGGGRSDERGRQRRGRASLRAPRPGRAAVPSPPSGLSVLPCPRPPTSCAAPREAEVRSAWPGERQVGASAGKARARG